MVAVHARGYHRMCACGKVVVVVVVVAIGALMDGSVRKGKF
jgi:hypothetical protein